MLSALLSLSLGAVCNRIRGGLWENHLPFSGKLFNVIVFSLFVLALQVQQVGTTGEGIPHYHLSFLAFLSAALAGIAMWLGQAPGWGRYIGALGGWENKKPEEVFLIDFILHLLRLTPDFSAINQHTVTYHNPKQLRLWGFCGMTLRGFYWGALLSLATFSVYPVLVSCLMGVVYLACIEVARATKGTGGKGWEWAEYVFGALLWVSVFI